eukprot:CAMPEP_0202839876 /NCGR_PEP_ID=MMETSP1389-20130828/54085_1 /ASSEMBLY_ACC=CAM_ASM_000865 /TAXON_ID=302021 /ORGANISM="Rhodomonas sp., Strain CCMP768" /LENGTH=179 /DNA_ID=CAMNT_0049516413 /DNA_START=213 /DNA_END=752 /DNA_ORIENTATION=-
MFEVEGVDCSGGYGYVGAPVPDFWNWSDGRVPTTKLSSECAKEVSSNEVEKVVTKAANSNVSKMDEGKHTQEFFAAPIASDLFPLVNEVERLAVSDQDLNQAGHSGASIKCAGVQREVDGSGGHGYVGAAAADLWNWSYGRDDRGAEEETVQSVKGSESTKTKQEGIFPDASIPLHTVN